jgi:phage FluMu gp28-like protein
LRFLFGLDLGKTKDPSTLTLIEQTSDLYLLRNIRSFPLHTPYPQIVSFLFECLNKEPFKENHTLVVDATGIGTPIIDYLREKLSVISVQITGGYNVVEVNLVDYRLPKRDLVGALAIVLESGRLKIAGQMDLARTLRNQLISFRVKIGTQGEDSYEADRGKHDDMVIALALPLWYAEQFKMGGNIHSRPSRNEIPIISTLDREQNFNWDLW